MKNSTLLLIVYCSGMFCLCSSAYSWSDVATHAAITEEAVQISEMDDYLKNQCGIQQGLSAEFQAAFYPALEERMAELEPQRTTRSALDWIRTGSQLEDKILATQYRSRHHFHDPIRNTGLDNRADHPEWRKYGPAYWSNYEFDFTGVSALNWAINGISNMIPTANLETWNWTRERFYNAMTYTAKSDRDSDMALALLSLGSVVHLLEDMGSPAHARNDFLFGHYRNWFTGFVLRWGNDLEDWVEEQIKDNNDQSLRSGSGPVVFDKLYKYFDTDTREPNGYLGDGVTPPDEWGLAECTNYQFFIFEYRFRSPRYQKLFLQKLLKEAIIYDN